MSDSPPFEELFEHLFVNNIITKTRERWSNNSELFKILREKFHDASEVILLYFALKTEKPPEYLEITDVITCFSYERINEYKGYQQGKDVLEFFRNYRKFDIENAKTILELSMIS
jgi:hypothetical protein